MPRYRVPILPTETGTNSSKPRSELKGVASFTLTEYFGTGASPQYSRRGTTNSRSTVWAASGYPGSPMTGLPLIFPSIIGLPGLTATP